MARTTISIPFTCSFEDANRRIISVLNSNGFHQTTLKTGEKVWKKGTGMMSAMKYVKVDFSAQEAVVSAWIQVGVGSVGGGEMDLTGIVGAIPKKSLMNVLSKIKASF